MKEKLNQLFKTAKVDSILIRNFSSFSDSNFYYFTGLYRESFSNNFLLLRKNSKPLILSTSLEFESIIPKRNFYGVKEYRKENELIQLLKNNLKGKRIGFNASLYPFASFKKLKKILKGKKFIDVSQELGKLRETKTREEIKKIREAVKITFEGINEVKQKIRAGIKELGIANELEYCFKKNDAEGTAFPSIIASGKNSSIPHHNTSTKKIKKGEIVLIDAGAKFKGYCADLSRTFFLGRASEEEKRIYEIVFNAQQESLKKIRGGVNASELFNASDSILKKELGKGMPHSIGHGIGLEAHDFPPRISGEKNLSLKKGMVLTIEPAFYKKNFFGIRIEDDVIVKEKTFQPLSKAPKELIEV